MSVEIQPPNCFINSAACHPPRLAQFVPAPARVHGLMVRGRRRAGFLLEPARFTSERRRPLARLGDWHLRNHRLAEAVRSESAIAIADQRAAATASAAFAVAARLLGYARAMPRSDQAAPAKIFCPGRPGATRSVSSMLPRRPTSKPCLPCLPRSAKEPPSGPDWIHEIKHDGFRILAWREAARVRLYTRNGYDFTARFPKIAATVETLPVRSCVLDGGAIVVDERALGVRSVALSDARSCRRPMRLRSARTRRR